MKHEARIGIIGGTGLGETIEKEAEGQSVSVETPFGPPSGDVLLAEWEGMPVAFLARHGPGHVLPPSAVPYRANIWALKSLGVQQIIASGATGSLREDIHPGELVICDQVIDKTVRRASSFFDEGPAVHVELADPFCPRLRALLLHAGADLPLNVHDGGTYVCMEGPQFSTRAESHMHRAWGGDLIGMTCMPEAKLAREAELCYALVALPTDYDCWRPHDPDRGRDALLKEILDNLHRASESAVRLIRAALRAWGQVDRPCTCGSALQRAIWSDRDRIAPAVRRRLALLLNPYLND